MRGHKMMKNGMFRVNELISEVQNSDNIPDLILSPFIQGKDLVTNKKFVAEEYMYAYSVRFVDKKMEDAKYLEFIAEKIYNKKISELTVAEIDLEKHTLYFLEKNHELYRESLLNYLHYMWRKSETIIQNFLHRFPNGKFEDLHLLIEVTVSDYLFGKDI